MHQVKSPSCTYVIKITSLIMSYEFDLNENEQRRWDTFPYVAVFNM